MNSRKAWLVSQETLEPTWAATKRPQAAPAIASPVRSRKCVNFLTLVCIDSLLSALEASGWSYCITTGYLMTHFGLEHDSESVQRLSGKVMLKQLPALHA